MYILTVVISSITAAGVLGWADEESVILISLKKISGESAPNPLL
jgi:hypothetical protein